MSPADPPPDGSAPLTELLQRAAAGEATAADAALPLIYRELRNLAQARMAGERRDHTLQATALVHETWLKLVGVGEGNWSDRYAFYRAAAVAMRRILVDHARRRTRTKRGGGAPHQDVAMERLAARPDDGDADTFLQLDRLIEQLSRDDPRAGEIVRLRFFAGLTVEETAAAMQLSRRTVLREWAFARAQLYAALRDQDHGGG
ncbi:MAG: sigma-70 family RNA polymerase sigma factor [Planctomycetes bacterium]|nr:sigma-70 family RNA polymerase sigma factor [Planctomycetota bacterium]